MTQLYALDYPGDRGDEAVQGGMVHNMRYLASIVTNTFVSFGDILSLHKRFVELAGGVSRIVELRDALNAAALTARTMKVTASAGGRAVALLYLSRAGSSRVWVGEGA